MRESMKKRWRMRNIMIEEALFPQYAFLTRSRSLILTASIRN